MHATLSLSADPAVTFIQKIRKMAYASEDNNVKQLFRAIPADKVEDCNLVVFGKRMAGLSTAVVTGFCVEDPVSSSCVAAFDGASGRALPPHTVRNIQPESVEVRGMTLGPKFDVLHRMPLENL